MFAKVEPNTQIIGQNIIYFNQVNSTNKFALELIKQNMTENGTVVMAEFQTEGKGQFGREWKSNPYENLMFSIILKHVTNIPFDPFLINKTMTISMYQCISKIIPHSQIKIKWPNDIYADNVKICGILIENNYTGQNLNYSIVGIGLNVNQDFETADELKATSIKGKTGKTIDRSLLLKQILEQVEKNYLLMNTDSLAIENLFNQNLLGYQESGEFEFANKKVHATIMECDKSGRLILKIKNENKPYVHGEIKQLIYA